ATAGSRQIAMNRVDTWRMIQRRAAELGMKGRIGCHTFRATGITAYLEAGGTIENAQAIAAHESPRTAKLYDRTGDEITLDEVERALHKKCIAGAHRAPLQSRTPSCRAVYDRPGFFVQSRSSGSRFNAPLLFRSRSDGLQIG